MQRPPTQDTMRDPAPETREVELHAAGVALNGDLTVPADALGAVVFAHGSGSSRKSPRNRMVARALQRAGLGTLLLDLLTPEEEEREHAGALLRFDVELLASRLAGAAAWLERNPSSSNGPIGYFGASTGAAAALIAAAEHPENVAAVVSRGGRPDLAGADALARVQAPTLLVVGGDDREVLELNRAAFAQLRCERELSVVPGASHLFQEPGTLEQVAALARDWFLRFFAGAALA